MKQGMLFDDRVEDVVRSDACWQYDIRVANMERDIHESGFSENELSSLKVGDFTFECVHDKFRRGVIKHFIKRHEWLGTLSQYTTHWFGAYYRGVLSGAVLMNLPNAFSKMLGEDTPNLERLISRGACISWSPKNLASSLIMWSIRYMVINTQYRLFTAYSDPEANELGTIYQSCNFYYLGQNSGTTTRYINPYTGRVVSDRFFRQRSAYKKYAKELGIKWDKSWETDTSMNWESVPDDIEIKLREFSKLKQSQSEKIDFLPKHKYAYVLGADGRETKHLRKIFLENNHIFPYPKNRGT